MSDAEILYEALQYAKEEGYKNPLTTKSIHYLRDVIENKTYRQLFESEDFCNAIFTGFKSGKEEWKEHSKVLLTDENPFEYLKHFISL